MTTNSAAQTRILLVEDDESFAQIFAASLEQKLGCNVSIAGDSFEAANLMAELGFDLILTDWRLADQTGFRALDRADRSLAIDPAAPVEWFVNKKTPVIVVTACDSSEIERERKLKKRFQFLGVVSKDQHLAGMIDQIEMIFGNFPARATA
ncbi:MAG: response regulator [Bdellovibrionota bacterium]